MSRTAVHVFARWILSAPAEQVPIIPWAEQHVRLVGSARSENFRADITPWTTEPIQRGNDGTHRCTFVKPIQCGGSTVGEIVIEYWLANWSGGDVQYNWPNDLKADARWKTHYEKKLRACKPVVNRCGDPGKWNTGLIVAPHLNFIMQGIRTDRAVASDTIRGQVNEEIHDADNWIPGRLEQAYGRTTAYWNAVIFNISNAGHKGDQLHQAYLSGTQQQWQVQCPGCRQFHVMRTRWEPDKPELGGLRYDVAEEERGSLIRILPSTIRYQMPCGYTVPDDIRQRRALSLSGRYSPVTDHESPITNRSYTLEAVAIDYISWPELIRQKQLALRARKLGDPKPWLDYLRERECQFVGAEDRRPETVAIVLSSRTKDRNGLANRQWRFAAIDYQVGVAALKETPHFWLVIQDFAGTIGPDGRVMGDGNSFIVWEGKCGSEGEVLDILARHQVRHEHTLIDASFTGEHRYVYFFAWRHGFNAIKVHGERTFQHADGVRRAWSEPERLEPHLAGQAGEPKWPPGEEPEFWNVSQSGAFDALAHLRARKDCTYEIPADVSEDFRSHFVPWSLEEYRVPATNQIELRWRKSSEKAADHLFCCCSYLALWAEMADALGRSSDAAIDHEKDERNET